MWRLIFPDIVFFKKWFRWWFFSLGFPFLPAPLPIFWGKPAGHCHHFHIWIWLLSSFSSLPCGRIMAFFAIILLKLLKSDYTISYSSSFALIWLHQLPPTPASNHIEETTSGIIVNLFQQVISKYQSSILVQSLNFKHYTNDLFRTPQPWSKC